MNMLYLKHRVVVSSWGATFLSLRHKLTRLRNLRHPELALLQEEDQMMRQSVRKALAHEAVCVDVGVRIGSVTQLFREAPPEGRHILIEASPGKMVWLRRAFPEYILHQVAVSDDKGEVSFFENLDNPGFSSLGNRDSRGRTQEIVAKCTTLDKLLADQPSIDMIKIDVEGFECNVVQGARRTLERLKPVVIFEAGAATDTDIDNESYSRLFRLLTEDMGYEIRPVFGWHFERPPLTEAEFVGCRIYPFTAFNFVAHPSEKIS